MTKKRFKLSMAALGLLAAFFVALTAMLLAPTLASADKNSGVSHDHGGTSDAGAPTSGSGGGSHGSIFADNEPGHGHEYGPDMFICANNIHACTDAGDTDDTHDGFHGTSDPHGGYGGDFSGGNKGGSSNGDGRYASNFWGGVGGGNGGGGNGAGGNGAGGDPDGDRDGNKGDKTGTNPSGDLDFDPDGDKSGPDGTDPGPESFAFNGPTDPSIGDDPPGGGDNPGDGPNTDGPNADGPSVTQLTDPVTPVPEPLTVSIFAIGLAGVAGFRRRQKTVQS